jgi:hypothetical protein
MPLGGFPRAPASFMVASMEVFGISFYSNQDSHSVAFF